MIRPYFCAHPTPGHQCRSSDRLAFGSSFSLRFWAWLAECDVDSISPTPRDPRRARMAVSAAIRAELDQVCWDLRQAFQYIKCVHVENKGLSASVDYRERR